jgi:hypothetical protein
MTESREPAPSEPDDDGTENPLLPDAVPGRHDGDGDVGEPAPDRDDPDPDDGPDVLV